MTNVRKLVARLNASTCRFDVGRGGIPELTQQDIAGALGMIKDELAREVFAAVWWPDGARLSRRALEELIARLQFGEWERRAEKLTHAQLAVMLARAARDREGERRGEAMLVAAQAQVWPGLADEPYAKIRRAVLDELCAPDQCDECKGLGDFVQLGRSISCTACGGRGRVPRSSRRRAAKAGFDEAYYRRMWRGVYEWTLHQVEEAEHNGVRELSERLAA